MNKSKLSYYASFVAIACGILILAMRLFVKEVSVGNSVMGIVFIAIGAAGLRIFRNQ